MQYDSCIDFPSPSRLSKRYGKEIVNYYAGSPLNRLSFLRSQAGFLRAALPHAKFLLLNNLGALSSSKSHLAFLDYPSLEPVLSNLYDLDDGEVIANYDSSKLQVPTVLFLGVDERYELENGLVPDSDGFQFEGVGWVYKGRPYFAVDVTDMMKDGRLGKNLVEREGWSWLPGRDLQLMIVPKEAAILAQAKSVLDWNARNKFCAACGNRTISVKAGTQRVCPPTDKALGDRPPCISRTGLHNIAFPRTDPSVIMAIVNHKGDKILLGRQSRWPPNMYSTLAGFCEPGESIEECVRRETWEESGVRVGRVVLHSSQPWPYPANLMIGCIGEALEDGEEIHLGHDPELQDATWFDLADIREALRRPTEAGEYKEGTLRVPGAIAIAHQLMLAVVNGSQPEAKI